MRAYSASIVFGLTGLALAGCSIPTQTPTPAIRALAVNGPSPAVVQTGYFAAGTDPGKELPVPKKLDTLPPTVSTKAAGVRLPDLINLTVERHPRLAQVTWAVETARGRAIQAGLYPNPTLSVTGDELGDRTGPGGIWTAPHFSQEIVTGNKLGLSKAAALKEVDQAALTLISERYRLFTDVRQNYWEVITLQRRAEVLGELIGLAEKSVENANKLLKAKEGSELDVVQLEVDLERYRADLEATNRTLPAAFRRLAASVGVQDLPDVAVVGDLDLPLPDYDLERLRVYVLGIHPELRSAQVGVERAHLVLKRVTVEPIPNVTVGTGYVRQNQNKSDDWVIAASIPVPLWNRNQGNIFAAKAQVGEAICEVGRVQNDLVSRLAS